MLPELGSAPYTLNSSHPFPFIELGPVLRSAVASLLVKRQMDHTISPTRGSFLVDALSGIDLYEDTSTRHDSKVIVVDQQDSCQSLHTTPIYRPLLSLHSYANSFHSNHKADEDEDSLLETIKEMSKKCALKEDSNLQTREEQEYKRALLKSLEWKRIQELDMNDDNLDIERVIELSRIENEVAEHEYNEILRKVTKSSIHSEKEYLSIIEKEQEALKLAMESSRNDYEALQKEEEEQLRLALQLCNGQQ